MPSTNECIEAKPECGPGGGLFIKRIEAGFSLFGALVVSLTPKVLLFLFIATFFFGIPRLMLGRMAVCDADLSFFFLALGFFSFLLQDRSTAAPVLAANARGLFKSLQLFFLWSVFSVAINIPFRPTAYGLNSIWYAIKLFELLLGLYIFSSKPISRYREYLLDLILGFSLFEVGFAVYQYFILHDGDSTGTLGVHHAMLGMMMAPAMAIALYRFLIHKSPVRKAGYAGIAALFLFTIILSRCRSVMTGIGLSLGIFILSNMKFKVRYFLFVAGALIAVLFLVKFTPVGEMINSTIHSDQSPSSFDTSSFGRLMVWQGALAHFLKASFIEKCVGIGMGCFSSITFDFFIFQGKFASGAHNNLLHVLMESGIIGLVLFCVLFFVQCRALLRASGFDSLAKPMFYLILTLLASGFTQETFWFQPVFGDFWLFTIVLTGLVLGKSTAENEDPVSLR